MRLFPFIVERAGGTYCSQHSGKGYQEAADRSVDYAIADEHLNTGALQREELASDMREAVALNGLTNAFFTSHLDAEDESWGINIVETAQTGQARRRP